MSCKLTKNELDALEKFVLAADHAVSIFAVKSKAFNCAARCADEARAMIAGHLQAISVDAPWIELLDVTSVRKLTDGKISRRASAVLDKASRLNVSTWDDLISKKAVGCGKATYDEIVAALGLIRPPYPM